MTDTVHIHRMNLHKPHEALMYDTHPRTHKAHCTQLPVLQQTRCNPTQPDPTHLPISE